jgi:hypothetical protein
MAFNALEEINIPLKLVAPQNLKITNTDGRVNKLVWDNFNFAGLGNLFIERAEGSGAYVTIAQIYSNNVSYDDDVSATGLIKYTYRISVRETGFANSKSVVGSIDLSTSIVFNVALNKPATASSTLSTLYPASNAVDGNTTADASRWVNTRGLVPAILEIDLQASFLISQIRIFTGLSGPGNPLTSFTFDYWDENTQSWKTIVTETNNLIPSYSKSFSEISANKVRLYINATADNTVRLFEIEVYGRRTRLGINDVTWSKFNIYPNPTSDILKISGDGTIELLQIFDVNGKSLISQRNANSVDVSSLPKGTYFMKLNNKETIKFIKK